MRNLSTYCFLMCLSIVSLSCEEEEDGRAIIKAINFLQNNTILIKEFHVEEFQRLKQSSNLTYAGVDAEFIFDVRPDGQFTSLYRVSDCDYVERIEGRTTFVPSNIDFNLDLNDITDVVRDSSSYFDEFFDKTRVMYSLSIEFQATQINTFDFNSRTRLYNCSDDFKTIEFETQMAIISNLELFALEESVRDQFYDQFRAFIE